MRVSREGSQEFRISSLNSELAFRMGEHVVMVSIGNQLVSSVLIPPPLWPIFMSLLNSESLLEMLEGFSYIKRLFL